jgi:hypothetical protein
MKTACLSVPYGDHTIEMRMGLTGPVFLRCPGCKKEYAVSVIVYADAKKTVDEYNQHYSECPSIRTDLT